MSKVSPVGGKVQIEIERFDEGLDDNSGPNEVSIYGSPDCQNVEFSQRGSVKTRFGCDQFTSSTIFSAPIVGMISYNNSMIAWANGTMYRMSGTTAIPVSNATGSFVTGGNVAAVVYQNVLFCSDGTSAFRYHTDASFYKHGIPTPSAPTGVQCNATAVGPPGDTYYYRVSFLNTAVVEGTAGSMSAAQTFATTTVVSVQQVPVAPASQPAAQRYIYRGTSTAGPFRYIATLNDNTTTTYTDTVGTTTWAVGAQAMYDNGGPTAYTTIKLHKDRLFYDNSTDRTILNFTNFRNPYVSAAANFINLDKGVGANIIAVASQDDLLTVFKEEAIWLIDTPVPGDAGSFVWKKAPGNIGIVGPKAFVEVPNGIIFMGKRYKSISGLHLLSGMNVVESRDQRLRADSISGRIEAGILGMPLAHWAKTVLTQYKNRLYAAVTITGETTNKAIYWLDLNRIGSEEGEVGSWSYWRGRAAQMNTFLVHTDGTFYGGSSQNDGEIFALEQEDQYNDAGQGINSYFRSKFIGGEQEIESWIKDFRLLNLWYNKNGLGTLSVYRRVDDETSDSLVANINLTAGTSVYGTAVYGVGVYGGGVANKEVQKSFGSIQGRRIQLNFTNSSVTDTAFEVHGVKILMNLRRQVKETT